MSVSIKYQFAYNEHDEIISINDVTKDYRASHSFHCIECGRPMIARLGKDRVPHFAHERGSESCNSESYLHKIAKRLIKKKFDSSEGFIISYYRDVICQEAGTCPFFDKEQCHNRELESFDLKQFYDICVEEELDGEKRADILLSNSEYPEREKVSIEVVVTHDISEDDPRKIIRAKIKSENDIKTFLGDISESKIDEYGPRTEHCPIISFYNFTRTSKSKKSLSCRFLNRFTLYPNGEISSTAIEDINENSCFKKGHCYAKDSILEISFDPEQYRELKPSTAGAIIALDKGLIQRSCVLCKYQESGFCCMSKKYGTPQHPSSKDANTCCFYSADEKLLSYGRYMLNSGKIKFLIVDSCQK